MPPKKKVEEVKPDKILGRLGTNLKIGIVGLPNVGKSTFFNVLTKSQAAAENFPFCTIDPNEARVPIPDARYDKLVEVWSPVKKFSAFLNVVDIAGLVKGAHEGAGLGNAFLSNIDSCDAIFHMLRVFEDDDITHVEGGVDPVRDIEIINDELRLKDLAKCERRMGELEKLYVRGGDKKLKNEFETLQRAHQILKDGKHIRYEDWNDGEIEELNRQLFLTAKPMIYLMNMKEKDYLKKKVKGLKPIKEWIDANDKGALAIPYSAAFEHNIFEMDDETKANFLEENKTVSMLDKIVVNGFKALGLEVFFTSGKDEVKAWVIKKGSLAPRAAGRIHTDFEKGFIMAEVMHYKDWEENNCSEAATKAAGKYHQKGKNYIVEDGDIIFFKFNTPNAGKKK